MLDFVERTVAAGVVVDQRDYFHQIEIQCARFAQSGQAAAVAVVVAGSVVDHTFPQQLVVPVATDQTFRQRVQVASSSRTTRQALER